jgi:hypothetical protein
MGNFPARAMSLPQQDGTVTVSTRSDPPHGSIVVQEVGLIVVNSSQFFKMNKEMKEGTRMMEALSLAREECTRLGGNYILGTNVEVKPSGDFLCYALTGTACVVKKAAVPY